MELGRTTGSIHFQRRKMLPIWPSFVSASSCGTVIRLRLEVMAFWGIHSGLNFGVGLILRVL